MLFEKLKTRTRILERFLMSFLVTKSRTDIQHGIYFLGHRASNRIFKSEDKLKVVSRCLVEVQFLIETAKIVESDAYKHVFGWAIEAL